MIRTIQIALQGRIQAILLAKYGITSAQLGAVQLTVEQPPIIALASWRCRWRSSWPSGCARPRD